MDAFAFCVLTRAFWVVLCDGGCVGSRFVQRPEKSTAQQQEEDQNQILCIHLFV